MRYYKDTEIYNNYEKMKEKINKRIDKVASKKRRINSYRKGSNFERMIAKKLSEKLNIEIVRVPQSGAFSSVNNTNFVAGDITTTDKNVFFPFVFELKHHNKENVVLELLNPNKKEKTIIKWVSQVKYDSKRVDKIPIVIFRLNRSPIFYILKYNNEVKQNVIDEEKKIVFYHHNIIYIIIEFNNFDLKKYYEILRKESEKK